MNKLQGIIPLSGFALACSLVFSGTVQAEWIKSYGTKGEDFGISSPTSENGGYLSLFSPTRSGLIYSTLLSLLDADGVVKWTKKLSTGGINDAFLTSELQNGRMLVQGRSKKSATEHDDAVWAIYNINKATGALTPVFRKIYKSALGSDLLIKESSTGVLLGAGSLNLLNKGHDIIVAKINPSTGLPDWSSILHNDYNDSVTDLLPKGDQFILAGSSSSKNSLGNPKILIGLLSKQGLPVAGSFKKYGGAGTNSITEIKPISGGNYLVHGSTSVSTGFGTNSTAFVLKLNGNLGLVWGKKIDVGIDKGISLSSIDEKANGAFTLTGELSEPEFLESPVPGIPPILIGTKQHPAVLQMSPAGVITSAKTFSYQDMDTAYFSKQSDGAYLLGGQTGPSIDLMSGGGLNFLDKADGLYGRFNANFSTDWSKTLVGPKGDSVSIGRITGGYSLIGSSNSWGAGGRDALVGKLDINGDVPGCQFINEVTMNETALIATSSNLGWRVQNTSVITNGSIQPTEITNVNIAVSNSAISVNDVCKN